MKQGENNADESSVRRWLEGLTSQVVGSSGVREPTAAGSLLQGAAALATVAKTIDTSTRSAAGPLGWLGSLSPVVSGLMKVFGGGGGSKEPPALPEFELPRPQRVVAGFTGTEWQPREVDYDAGGMPRVMGGQAERASVVVQVQAMDSRSFLDHRDEIASAVRQALLESHGLGDVLSER